MLLHGEKRFFWTDAGERCQLVTRKMSKSWSTSRERNDQELGERVFFGLFVWFFFFVVVVVFFL